METMYWRDGRLYLLDQTRLPAEVEYVACATAEDVARAISEMKVRGAPAIGAASAYGMALGANGLDAADRETFLAGLRDVGRLLTASRPTAVNLRWAVDRLIDRAVREPGDVPALRRALLEEAHAVLHEDVEINRRIGAHGQVLVPDGARILTHCNAGALATAGYGTALGVIRAAYEAGKKVTVFADETRPFLQGARLTSLELMADGIPVVLIADSMAGYLMAREGIDLVVVGADRIAANGDTANKIGTYGVAVLARAHKVPFYVAAPVSTVDFSISDGAAIPIEERDQAELTHFQGRRIAPEGVKVWNPAFDVTPHGLITAIITEAGVIYPPYTANLARVCSGNRGS
ncbi:MAG: S-methyl-5-thioribose-1-phosphate isomerase [Thermoanaerobacterales bacterium]|nr:S-methyl-5-thioribose-1-phosphate isomerase [Bacillota bacterium]MDI6907303.1 S-methyl-5-thioribose-1-phosphate isomerase [Thermoanaerobacterales bacterium]